MARIAQNSSSILRCTFLARRSAKLIANFSATMVTSLPSFSLSLYLSLSLSLSPNVPHAQYRKRFRASYYPVCGVVSSVIGIQPPSLCEMHYSFLYYTHHWILFRIMIFNLASTSWLTGAKPFVRPCCVSSTDG